MSCLFGHKWNGCKCTACHKVRDEQHTWNGCKCTRCYRIRNEGHRLVAKSDKRRCIARCEICGYTLPPVPHKWDGRFCTVCGEERNAFDIDDQSVLEHIAKNDPNQYERGSAVMRLTDQSVLAGIAKNDESEYVRRTAIEALTDPAALSDIARNESNDSLRIKAMRLAIVYKDPVANKENCENGVHVWEFKYYNDTGDSYTSGALYECRICGKKETQFNDTRF